MKLFKGNDIESVIARSNSLRPLEAVPDTRWCTPRSAGLPRKAEVLCCVACQHQIGTAEKGGGKVGCSFGSDCYSPLLHTSAWPVEENTCLGEEVGGPGALGVYVCLQVAFPSVLAKLAHQRVRHVDEMALYHPS